jgi:hypothetical protein
MRSADGPTLSVDPIVAEVGYQLLVGRGQASQTPLPVRIALKRGSLQERPAVLATALRRAGLQSLGTFVQPAKVAIS